MAVKIGYESGYAEGRASRDAEVEKLASWKGGGIEVSLDAWEALQARVLESQQHREAMNKEPKNLVDERDAVDPRWYKMDFDFVKAKIDALKAERDSALAKLAALEITKDAAYAERNRLVSLLSKVFPSGKKQTAIEGWSEDWHGCVYIDLPTGQASWHYHTEQSWLFAHLPEYQGTWDGHTTNEKYERIQSFAAGAQAQPLSDGEIYTAYIEATNQTLRPQDERLALLFARAIEKAHKIGGSV